MKKYISSTVVALSLLSITLFTSCSSDDNSNPVTGSIEINLTEVGHATPAHAHAGEDLHLEAEILASQKIATVSVELQHESNSSAPIIRTSFTDYAGLLNATFHKHIDIPATQPSGHYHLRLTVTDQDGNSKTETADVEVLPAGDESTIEIELTELGHGTIATAHAHAGEDMHIEGHIHSSNPVATIEIEMHHESNTSAPEIMQTFSNYAGQTEVDFHEHIAIPANQPAGEYHFHITVTDNQGNSKTAEYHLEIE